MQYTDTQGQSRCRILNNKEYLIECAECVSGINFLMYARKSNDWKAKCFGSNKMRNNEYHTVGTIVSVLLFRYVEFPVSFRVMVRVRVRMEKIT